MLKWIVVRQEISTAEGDGALAIHPDNQGPGAPRSTHHPALRTRISTRGGQDSTNGYGAKNPHAMDGETRAQARRLFLPVEWTIWRFNPPGWEYRRAFSVNMPRPAWAAQNTPANDRMSRDCR